MNFKHGDAKVGAVTRLHSVWRGILKRCSAVNGYAAEKYSKRGIIVCDEWRDYLTFKAWAVSSGYADDLSIDRIDNAGPYSPDNCRWIPMREQARNRRNNRIIEWRGKRQCIAAWAEETGVAYANIVYRSRKGWPPERIFQ